MIDQTGNEIPEWGVQRLRHHAKGQKISAYIQSTAGSQFQVSVQPRVPFFDADHHSSGSETDIETDIKINDKDRDKGTHLLRSL